VEDYVKASGDMQFLKETWESLKKAYEYIRRTDTDNDGLMENTVAGLGASELGSLREGLKVGIFLSGVSVESYKAMNKLAILMYDRNLTKQTKELYKKGKKSINSLLYNPETEMLPFGISTKDELKNDITVWPAVPLMFKLIDVDKKTKTLSSFSEHHLSTDWGVRMLSNKSPFYEPIAYNNGAVWPFLTGYVAMAEYNNNFSYAGFTHLKQMANNVFQNSLGNYNELFSGEFFKPVSTSVPHQLFSTSPVVTSTVRGVFGLKGNALEKTIIVSPKLPADWDYAKLVNFRLGNELFEISLKKAKRLLIINLNRNSLNKFTGIFNLHFGLFTKIDEVKFNGDMVDFDIINERQCIIAHFENELRKINEIEVHFQQGIEILSVYSQSEIGENVNSLKITDYFSEGENLVIVTEGIAGRIYNLKLKSGFKIEKVESCDITGINEDYYELEIKFDGKKGKYVKKELRILR